MKFSHFLLLSLFALNIACTSSDDNYQPILSSFNVSNLVSIPNSSPTYNLNDTLYLDLNVPLSITTDANETISLTELVPNAQFAEFYLFRYKKADTLRKTPIPFKTTDVFISKGTGRLAADGIALTATKDTTAYKVRLGIKLNTAGEFFFGPYNQTTVDAFYTVLQDAKTLDIVELKTSISGQTPGNRFSFEVLDEE
ncbi:hypothetical protein [Leeuwenhoekiella sp. NPDC079379]|uniref:hypothetical protein n=1 Tax=Leeuwenhoekiella sp. NPDC079379 TaxID=3364122 RepID=UPI0037CA2D86